MAEQPKWFITTKSWLGGAIPALFLMLPLFGVMLSTEQTASINEFVSAAVGVLGMGLNTWGVLARKSATTVMPQ